MSDRVLPNDVKILIFKKLQVHVAALCRQVCKHWNELISNSLVLWKGDNYEEFCERIRDIPLKYHYMFKPRHLTRKQMFRFLEMCHVTTEKQLVKKYKLGTKEQIAKIDMKRFCKGTMLYLVVKKKITLEQLSLIVVPPLQNNLISSIFSDIGVWYVKHHRNIQKLYNKSFVAIAKRMQEFALRHMEKHFLSEETIAKVQAIESTRTKKFVSWVVFSPFGRMLLQKNMATIEQIIAHPLDFLAIVRNEYGIKGLEKNRFTLDQVIGDARLCYHVANHITQRGLKEKLFTIDELKNADHNIMKLASRSGTFFDCLREKLFTLSDCKKLLFPEYLRFLISRNGRTALREGLVNLENVSLHFQWDDPTLIPKKMTDEHLSNIRQLKKLKF
jgi:hypothetical protein